MAVAIRAALRRSALVYALAGVTLGAAAFVADEVPPAVAQFVTPLVSSGSAWGLVALVIGYVAWTYRSAAVVAVGVLALSTVTYYALILVVSQRWNAGVQPWEVDSAAVSLSGLASVARAMTFWLVASVGAGVFMGWLGQAVRRGTTRLQSIASGIAMGFLPGEGTYAIFQIVVLWGGPVDSFHWSRLLSAVVQVTLAVVVVSVLLWLRRRSISWWVFVVTAAASVVAGTTLWHLVASVRMVM
ncbi:hypothetical protein [Polymorphospora rubra]|uniref:hypothetical protein n=1 Tax=Polymorphospora rubra TaxID=338584 RepID=UPI001BB35E3A|nr:hypothetical protein [Polymorphospora rubra]